MSTKIYIVEDEPIIAETIQTALSKEGYEIAGMSDNAKEALFDIEQLQPDIILLDINLEGTIDGIELAGFIRKKFAIPFIFLTSYSDDQTLERVKEQDPAGYIVKPFNERNLKTSIELALHKSKQKITETLTSADDDSIFIKVKNELLRVDFKDILFIEAFDNYCFVVTARQKHLVSFTLKKLEEKLPQQMFLRVHRSYVVNLSRINSLQDGDAFIENHRIPVSLSYKEQLMERINTL